MNPEQFAQLVQLLEKAGYGAFTCALIYLLTNPFSYLLVFLGCLFASARITSMLKTIFQSFGEKTDLIALFPAHRVEAAARAVGAVRPYSETERANIRNELKASLLNPVRAVEIDFARLQVLCKMKSTHTTIVDYKELAAAVEAYNQEIDNASRRRTNVGD